MKKTRTVLVTGASRGIGKSIALRLARDGYRVIAVSRQHEAIDALVDSLENEQLRHVSVSADLMAVEGRESLLDSLPLEDLDCVVHNLGGSNGVTDFWSPAESYRSVWQFNVGIAHELNRRIVPTMVKKKSGRIVLVSTLAVLNATGSAPYAVSKAALEGYIRLLARELRGSGVVAAGVRPGAIRVPGRYLDNLEKTDPHRFAQWLVESNSGVPMGSPDEVAAAVAFLCSAGSSYMSGAILDVNGGV